MDPPRGRAVECGSRTTRSCKRDGVTDTAEAARTYLHGIIGDVVEPERIDTYLDRGPEMLSFVLKNTPLKMCWVPDYSDYYPESPGGRPGGRSIEPKPFNAKKLGADLDGLEPPYGKVPLNVVVMQQDYVRLNMLKRHPRGVLRSLKVGARTVWAKATGKNLVGMGRALIAPLRIGLQKAGVPVRLNTAFTDLYVEDGVVRGIYVRDTDAPESAEPELIRARRGVILGSGGFEHNEQMRVKYQRAPITTEWTVGAKANTGDGIIAGEKLGAALDIMEDAWWGPTVPLVGAPWFALSERNSPGSIIVNMSGKRFMNESMPYVEACHHMYGGEYGQGPGPGENIPAWLVFDQQYRDRYIFAGLQAGQRIPKKWMESGVIVKADTLEELAAKAGLPADALADDRGAVQRLRALGHRRGLPPRRERLRPLLRRPDQQAQPQPRRDQPRAVLRGQDGARRPRHQGRHRHRRARPRAAGRRVGDRGPLRRRQCQRAGDGPHLSGTRRHDRPRDGVRLPGGAAHSGEEPDMPINLDEALGAELEPAEFSWTSSDIQLYHLGSRRGPGPDGQARVALPRRRHPAGAADVRQRGAELSHDTEPPTVKFPGIDIELSRVLHASEAVSAPAPIPPSGTGVAVTKFTDIWDKGKAAVIWSETTVTTPDGKPLWTQKRSIFARGEGGFGGERGPSTSSEPPQRAPDFELAIPVSPQQALLYRMCGDRNPLHSDPEFAAAAGFPRPILHGLCTYGMTCKAMVDALLDGDTAPGRQLRRPVRRRGVPRRDAQGERVERG